MRIGRAHERVVGGVNGTVGPAGGGVADRLAVAGVAELGVSVGHVVGEDVDLDLVVAHADPDAQLGLGLDVVGIGIEPARAVAGAVQIGVLPLVVEARIAGVAGREVPVVLGA